MGFDLYGVEPANKTGEYFRNNSWYWRPCDSRVARTC
jgi:hypothetical protein